MSILIKGMEMPTRCENCGFVNPYRHPPTCGLTGTRILGDANARLDNCPLVEIPPHGRLIDADALMRVIPREEMVSRFAVSNAPTIIEAEGDE